MANAQEFRLVALPSRSGDIVEHTDWSGVLDLLLVVFSLSHRGGVRRIPKNADMPALKRFRYHY